MISIGANAFRGCSGITKLTIPENVTSIGAYAFQSCSNLDTVYFNVENCTYEGMYYEGNNIKGLPFYNDISIKAIILGDKVERIPDYAFYGCSGITGPLTFPENVTSIGAYAFFICRGITELTIPENVTSIGECAFQFCSKLDTVYFNARNCADFNNSGPFCNDTSIKTVRFGDKVERIPAYAFRGCSGITGPLTVPENVTSIGANAFRGCSGITGPLTIPENVTSIGERAFQSCYNLDTVYFNAKNCADFSISGPFCYNTSIKTVRLGDKVERIHAYAFYGCSNITISLTFSNGLISIGDAAFCKCKSIIGLSLPMGITTIGDSAFYNCSSITGPLTFPEGLTYVGEHAFENCSNITSLMIPEGFTSISQRAFAGCSKISGSVVIPEGISTISEGAFAGCSNVTKFSIPKTVLTIEPYAFSGCKKISMVVDKNLVAQDIDSTVFEDVFVWNAKLKIKTSSKPSYVANKYWRMFEIEEADDEELSNPNAGIIHDTVYLQKLVYIHDTMRILDTVYIHDTVSVRITDTVYLNTDETKITEANEITGVKIFPNPSSGMFNVEVPIDATIEIFDAGGRKLLHRKTLPGTHAYHLQNSGTYFVRLTSANQKTTTQKVVVK